MKKLILFTSAFILSQSAFSETYSCSSELSNFGRPGEVETIAFIRSGNFFLSNSKQRRGVPNKILLDSNTDIILYQLFQSDDDAGLLVTMINKKSMKYKQEYLDIKLTPTGKRGVLIGDCILY